MSNVDNIFCPRGAFVMFISSRWSPPSVIDGSKDDAKYKNLQNWSGAIGYGVGSGSPLSPSFNFCLELAKSSKVCFIFAYSEVCDLVNCLPRKLTS